MKGFILKYELTSPRLVHIHLVAGNLEVVYTPVLPVLPVRAPGRLQLDLLVVFDVTLEGIIDQQSVIEDSTRPSFFEHA